MIAMRRCPSPSRCLIAWSAPEAGAAETDEAGPAVGQAAGAPVGDVAALLDDPGDELPRLGGDVVAAVEHAGDGGDRHAGLVRHFANGHPGVRELGHTSIEARSGTFTE